MKCVCGAELPVRVGAGRPRTVCDDCQADRRRAYLAQREEKMTPVIFRMTAEDHQELKRRAAEEERSMAQTIRRALKLYLRAALPDNTEGR